MSAPRIEMYIPLPIYPPRSEKGGGGYQRLVSDIQDSGHGPPGVLAECLVDLLGKGLLLDLDDQVHNGDVGCGHTQSNSCAISPSMQ
jgi:hypothetical protein